jgi:hypothetical protein
LPAVAAVFAQHAAAGEEPQALVVETPDSMAQNPRTSCRKATAVEPNAKLLRLQLTNARSCNAPFSLSATVASCPYSNAKLSQRIVSDLALFAD